MQAVLPPRYALVRALHTRFGSKVDLAEIEAEVEVEFAEYAEVRITAFVPILVEREVEARLRLRRPRVTSSNHILPRELT